VALVEQLAHGIVPPHVEAHFIDVDRLGVHILLVPQAIEIGRHECLDNKRAIVGEMGRDVLETAHLVVLGEEIEQGVEHDVDQVVAVRDRHVGEVTDGDRNLVAARLGAESGDHRG
jgi:hypothetical protein